MARSDAYHAAGADRQRGPYVSEGALASAHMNLLGSEKPQGRFIRYQIQQIS